MVKKALLVLLILVTVMAAGPNQAQTFCSAFCQIGKCTTQGFSSGDCTSCNSDLKWFSVSGLCTVNAVGYQYLDCSDDAGGLMTVLPAGNTASCPNLTSYLGYAPYGDFLATDSVTVTLAGGTDVPHWGLDFIFNIILIDTDSSTSNKRWPGGTVITVSLNTAPAISKTFKLDSSNPSSTYKNYCADTGRKDSMWQYKNPVGSPFIHNLTTTDIIFTITTDNNNNQAIWVAKEFIVDLRICDAACLSCNASGTLNVCFSCDASLGYMLNNQSCLTICKSGFGYTSDPAICVFCDLHCVNCYESFDNCTKCQTSGAWKSYLYYNDSLGYYTCINPCPSGLPAYYVNTTDNTCTLCDAVCQSCSKNSSYCFNCTATYMWYNYYCYNPCPSSPALYVSNGGLNCSLCNVTCTACTDLMTCTACVLNGTNKAYLYNSICYKTCPSGTFPDTNYGQGPNICVACTACATCTANPSPCQSCLNGTFLYNATCVATCPTGYIEYTVNNQCLDCSTYCVDLTINPYFADALSETLYIDMTFTKPVDFTVIDMTTFQTIDVAGMNPSEYTVTYTQLSNSSYRIIVKPTGYIFLYNQTVTVTTKAQPATTQTSIDLTPFKTAVYSKTGTINWFLLKSPSMSEMEKTVINNIASISSISAAATTSPVVAQMKKAGLFNMLFSGAQATTTTVFVNSIPSQNMYEAVRFWGIFVLYDVPQWEQNSKIPNNVFGMETHGLVKDQRLLFDMTTTPWRYQRTGLSSFFLYDVYIPLLLIGICWILILVAYIWRKFQKLAFTKLEGKFFVIMHKLHEAVILYVTTAMMLEWMYFDAASGQRWISLLVCLFFTLYFVGYELYIYYDMIKYPEAFIGNAKYEYYLNRYGSFLKNLRFQEYDMNEEWSPKHWFRPYNYHILSYYKKFCMIVSLPLFYELNHCQPAVLVMLQMLEMARFLATKPYYAKWRNIFRFTLELFLLFFFTCVLINTYIIDKITVNDPNTLDYYVQIYYAIGWVGFTMVFAFNIGFIIQFIIDVAQGFRFSNRELMEEARRIYYYDRITTYEREKDQVPLGLMNRWVKLGNLNKRNHEQLPDINVRIEYFKLVKHNEYFDVQVFKTVELFMNTDLNYHRENNTTVGKKIRKRLKLSRETSKTIFGLLCDVFAKHARRDTEAIVIKTFVRVIQSHFQPGDRIPLIPNEMFQKIELENHTGEKEHIKLKEKLKGFPLNPHDLESI